MPVGARQQLGLVLANAHRIAVVAQGGVNLPGVVLSLLPTAPRASMEINAFVTLRGTFSVGGANQMDLPPAVRDMLQRSLQRSSAFPGLPSGRLVLGPPNELSGENMGPSTDEANRADHPFTGAFFSGAPAIGVLSGGDATDGLSAVGGMPGATPAMNERIRRLSGAIAGSIFSDLVTGAIRVGEPGPPPASESAIAKLERGVTPEPGARCTICLCGLDEAPSEGDGPVPTLARMPCGHDFHEPCLFHWVREHNTCPVCRYALEHDPQPRMPPLISMLHGWREAAEAASAPEAALGEGPEGSHGFGRTIELPLGVELSGMQLLHTDMRPSAPPSEPAAPSSLSAALERIASRHRRRALGMSTEDVLSRGAPDADGTTSHLSPSSRISIAELRHRLEAIGVQPPLLAPKAELVRLLNLHERLHRVARRNDGPGPQLRLQMQMQMVQLPNAQLAPPPAGQAEASGAASPRRSGRFHGRATEEAGCEEKAEADDGSAHRAKRQRVRHT